MAAPPPPAPLRKTVDFADVLDPEQVKEEEERNRDYDDYLEAIKLWGERNVEYRRYVHNAHFDLAQKARSVAEESWFQQQALAYQQYQQYYWNWYNHPYWFTQRLQGIPQMHSNVNNFGRNYNTNANTDRNYAQNQ